MRMKQCDHLLKLHKERESEQSPWRQAQHTTYPSPNIFLGEVRGANEDFDEVMLLGHNEDFFPLTEKQLHLGGGCMAVSTIWLVVG